MLKVFISHSSKDHEFVRGNLIPFLNAHSIETWYSADDILTADEWERKIVNGLQSCNWFLVVMSPNAIQSDWVKAEVDWAMEKRKGKVIPVLLRECDPVELHLKLFGIQNVDFTKNHNSAYADLLATWDQNKRVVNSQSKIVFKNYGDSVPGIPRGILIMSPDGIGLTRIRSSGSTPEWSPDGKWIAFCDLVEGYKPYAYNIHIMKPDGTGVQQITRHTTGGAYSPAWSSDSRTIAYYVFEDGAQHQIWTVDVISGKQRQLARDGISPVWTSTNEIVFEKNKDNHAILIMNSHGEQLRECGLFDPGDWSIRWSRNGDKIVFLRNREIYVTNSGGSDLQNIRAKAEATGVSWSPDGQQLVYCASRSESGQETGKEVYIIDSNGANERRIVANPWGNDKVAECVDVCWSPWLN